MQIITGYPDLSNIQAGKLQQNYTPDRLCFEEMLCFTSLYDGDNLVAFSGLQDMGGTYRVNSRCYVSPPYQGGPRYIWSHLARYQIELAEDLGLTELFWSTERYKNPEKMMAYTIGHASQHLPEGWKFEYDGVHTIRGVEQAVCLILKS